MDYAELRIEDRNGTRSVDLLTLNQSGGPSGFGLNQVVATRTPHLFAQGGEIFAPVVEAYDLKVMGGASAVAELLGDLEWLLVQATRYWAKPEYELNYVYIRARAKGESGVRYALIRDYQLDDLGEPWGQVFASTGMFNSFILGLTRGPWYDALPNAGTWLVAESAYSYQPAPYTTQTFLPTEGASTAYTTPGGTILMGAGADGKLFYLSTAAAAASTVINTGVANEYVRHIFHAGGKLYAVLMNDGLWATSDTDGSSGWARVVTASAIINAGPLDDTYIWYSTSTDLRRCNISTGATASIATSSAVGAFPSGCVRLPNGKLLVLSRAGLFITTVGDANDYSYAAADFVGVRLPGQFTPSYFRTLFRAGDYVYVTYGSYVLPGELYRSDLTGLDWERVKGGGGYGYNVEDNAGTGRWFIYGYYDGTNAAYPDTWVSDDQGRTWETSASYYPEFSLPHPGYSQAIAETAAGDAFAYIGSGTTSYHRAASNDPIVVDFRDNAFEIYGQPDWAYMTPITNSDFPWGWTHLFQYNANTTSYTELDLETMKASGVDVFASTSVNDALYIGIDENIRGATFFYALYLELTNRGTMQPWAIEYWDGSAWSATGAVDTTGGGAWPGFIDILPADVDDWATTTVNGVTGIWLRLRSTIGSSNAPSPKLYNFAMLRRNRFSFTTPDVDGPVVANFELEDFSNGLNLTSFTMGIRQASRGEPLLNPTRTYGVAELNGNYAALVSTFNDSTLDTPLQPGGKIYGDDWQTSSPTLQVKSNTRQGWLWRSVQAKAVVGTFRVMLRYTLTGASVDDVPMAFALSGDHEGPWVPATKGSSNGVNWIELGAVTLGTRDYTWDADSAQYNLTLGITATTLDTSDNVYTFAVVDIVLIPVDEWSIYAESSKRFDGPGDRLIITSTENPRKPVTTTRYTEGEPSLYLYHTLATGPCILQPNTKYYCWFAAGHINRVAAPLPQESPPNGAFMIGVRYNRVYPSLRG